MFQGGFGLLFEVNEENVVRILHRNENFFYKEMFSSWDGITQRVKLSY